MPWPPKAIAMKVKCIIYLTTALLVCAQSTTPHAVDTTKKPTIIHLAKTASKKSALFAESYFKEVNKHLKKIGYQINLIDIPFLRSLYLIEKGEIDGHIGRTQDIFNGHHFKNIYLIDSAVTKIQIRVIVPEGSPIKKISDISKENMIVGNIKDDIFSLKIARKYHCLHAQNYQQLLTLLHKKRIHLFLSSSIGEIQLFDLKAHRVRILEEVLAQDELKPALHIKYKGSIFEKELNKIIKEMKKIKLFQKMNKKYLEATNSKL